jgi:hypothetical protein
MASISEAIVRGMQEVAGKLQKANEGRSVSMHTSLIKNIVAEFNPIETDVTSWIHEVDEYVIIYGWDSKTTSHLALSKLRGAAEVWYRVLPSHLFTWEQWREIILNNFQKKRYLHGSMKAMIDCTTNKYDTYYEYHFAKLALIHKLKLPISQGDQVNLVMGGLEDERIKIAIETSNINTPEVLAAHFRVLDEQRLGRSKPETSNDSPTVSPAISKPKTYTNTQRATGAEKYKAWSSSARFPKKPDKAKDSTKSFQPTCFKCGGRGHFRRFCPSNNNNDQRSTAKRPLLTIEPKHVNFIGPSANSKFFKTITIERRQMKCFADFGSECSLISETAVQLLSATPVPLKTGVTLSALGGHRVIPTGSVLLDIVIDEINKQIEFYVINKCVTGVEILVGQNFTELPDVNYSKSGNLLKFSQLSTLNVNSISEAIVNVGIDNDKVVKGLIGLLNEYSDCRASNISQIGVNPTVQMTIQLTNAEPTSRRARQYSDCERAQIRDLVEELLQNNIIRESNSPYARSVLLVISSMY